MSQHVNGNPLASYTPRNKFRKKKTNEVGKRRTKVSDKRMDICLDRSGRDIENIFSAEANFLYERRRAFVFGGAMQEEEKEDISFLSTT